MRFARSPPHDGVGLGIDQVADPAVGADFPPPPRDFPDDPGALADRRQRFPQREVIDGDRRGGPGLIDRAADGDQRLRQPVVGGGSAAGRRGFASIRATASSTMRVSALRLRLAYSVRNQRPREVSMKASLIAS